MIDFNVDEFRARIWQEVLYMGSYDESKEWTEKRLEGMVKLANKAVDAFDEKFKIKQLNG